MNGDRTQVVVSNLFYDALKEVKSKRTLDDIARKLELLASFPDMGRMATSASVTSRFGNGVRTLVCGNCVLVYRHSEEVVHVLALYPARLVVH